MSSKLFFRCIWDRKKQCSTDRLVKESVRLFLLTIFFLTKYENARLAQLVRQCVHSNMRGSNTCDKVQTHMLPSMVTGPEFEPPIEHIFYSRKQLSLIK